MKNKRQIIYYLITGLILLIFILAVTTSNTKSTQNTIVEYYSPETDSLIQYYNHFTNNHYHKIFNQNENRNAAGFRFFQHIYDTHELSKNRNIFDMHNKFYCAVSGSVIPPRKNNYDIIKVTLNNSNPPKKVTGKYYRCCTPCNCDIMKYATVVKTRMAIPKNSNQIYDVYLLTIADPCSVNKPLQTIPGIDHSVFACSIKENTSVIDKGYRVDSNNTLTRGPGRLVIGILFDVSENDAQYDAMAETAIKNCEKRFNTRKENHKSGMGKIFIDIAD